MSTACLFLGPTLRMELVPNAIDVYAPAALGSIYQAVLKGYERIGIVDGLFGSVPSVWHKEILYAVSSGARVFGAASMGALRAAELYQYGMVGIGRIYRLYRRGVINDDDEVAVIHAPAELDYAPLSESMINIRYTLKRLERVGFISKQERTQAADAMKETYFPKRSIGLLTEILAAKSSRRDAERALAECYADAKADDTILLMRTLEDGGHEEAARRIWKFPVTEFWQRQFVQMHKDVPPLESFRRR